MKYEGTRNKGTILKACKFREVKKYKQRIKNQNGGKEILATKPEARRQ